LVPVLLIARYLIVLYYHFFFFNDTATTEIYTVGGGPENERNLLEVIERIGTLTGKQPRYTFADWREGDQAYYVSDITKANEQLGWKPEIPFDQGLRDLVAWARELA
jgi:CDP-paratose 2-epimerase